MKSLYVIPLCMLVLGGMLTAIVGPGVGIRGEVGTEPIMPTPSPARPILSTPGASKAVCEGKSLHTPCVISSGASMALIRGTCESQPGILGLLGIASYTCQPSTE